jgi:cobyrinic acid a,c-diamide synthase
MALGESLIDADGAAHPMLGLLPLVTSFAERRRALGYRILTPRAGAPWPMRLAGHEHHASTALSEGPADPLYDATDAAGARLPPMGLQIGRVSGSYAHVIAPMPEGS